MSVILSVGIDIGTSTTQLIFSEITMENTAGYFTAPRISIIDKKIVYKSPVYTTPLIDMSTLDGDEIRQLVQNEFRSAGFQPSDVDTGAVIITGESARKDNAALVLDKLSSFAGEFVVSTAGPDLESVIAGKGSGAYAYSSEHSGLVANLDIGGGTTNIAVFKDGETVGKGCFDIGGRLIRLTPDYRITYLSPAARLIAEASGCSLSEGQRCTEAELTRVTDKMAELLAEALGLAPKEELLGRVLTTHSSRLDLGTSVKRIFFSGGVGECIYDDEAEALRYGDIGPLLAASIRRSPYFGGGLVARASETIRATVIGAGSYTTSISGSTIKYSDGVFPVKSVPALKLEADEEFALIRGNEELIYKKIKWFMEQSDTQELLLAFTGPADPTYFEIKTMASCITGAMSRALPRQVPIIVIAERDIAKALGAAIERVIEPGRRFASIDNIKIESGDYVDIGKPLMGGLVVPVIVKTLLFG